MDDWIAILLPIALILARVSGFFVIAPIFGQTMIPARIRVALVLLVTIFLAMTLPVTIAPQGVHWVRAAVLIVGEIVIGAAIALAARLVCMAVQQGAQIIGRQMGMMMANVVDPTTGQRQQPIAILFDMSFMTLFVIAGGHRLLLAMLARSYDAFPAGGGVDIAALTNGVIEAGSEMLLLSLKLAAPALAAFLVLGVLLGVMARVLPEMNILMASFPLRIALGVFLAVSIYPLLDGFVVEVTDWMDKFLTL